MDFVSNQQPQIEEMLEAIGIADIKELFSAIPEEMQLPRPSEDDGLSEYEGMKLMESLASRNTFPSYENYLGAGAYEHHVPSLVGAICSKSEFLTAYTPYQAEASQGMLQAMFEFQSAICALTGLDVANASVYDGATACAEAVLMALRHHKKRKKVLVGQYLHPHYDQVVRAYLDSGDFQVETLSDTIDDQTAAILVQYPNFLGGIDDLKSISARAKEKGALTIVSANPLVYGLYASAAEIGADIAIGDCQPFGLPLQYGGPYAGYISCKKEYTRQLPGRIVGETVDTEGRRGFVLTLQAREQHIRREKATSNICTNQALAALASLVSILWYGKKGVYKLALTNYQRAAYLKNQLEMLSGVQSLDVPFFNEFVISFGKSIEEVQHHFRQHGIEPGLDLGRYYPKFKDHLLIAVTEIKSKQQLDRFCAVAKDLVT